jgi:hypothetical protein
LVRAKTRTLDIEVQLLQHRHRNVGISTIENLGLI